MGGRRRRSDERGWRMDAITPLQRQRDPPESTWNTFIANTREGSVTIQAITHARVGTRDARREGSYPPHSRISTMARVWQRLRRAKKKRTKADIAVMRGLVVAAFSFRPPARRPDQSRFVWTERPSKHRHDRLRNSRTHVAEIRQPLLEGQSVTHIGMDDWNQECSRNSLLQQTRSKDNVVLHRFDIRLSVHSSLQLFQRPWHRYQQAPGSR